MPNETRRTVMLRETRTGRDRRFLWAWLDGQGNLHIDGQDLGPGTSSVSGDGEYEWFSEIAAADVPRVVALLDGDPGEPILALLGREWTGERADELERRLSDSDIPITRSTWSG